MADDLRPPGQSGSGGSETRLMRALRVDDVPNNRKPLSVGWAKEDEEDGWYLTDCSHMACARAATVAD